MNKLKKLPKRLLVQFGFFLLQNPLLGNYAHGQIYQGELKRICTPGLNCYSCPAAVTSCPIGALQLFVAGAKQSVSLFVAGFLLSIGVVFGRFICGYVCPMGLLQDLIYKIKAPKLRVGLRYTRYIKYAVLLIFVVYLPFAVRHELSGLGDPWFCKYLCPSGMIFASVPILAVNESLRELLGVQFVIKTVVTAGVLVAAVFVFRFFCRVLCPLGAFYSFFNPIAVVGMNCDKAKCLKCGKCAEICNVRINPSVRPNSPECIRCGDCLNACTTRALSR